MGILFAFLAMASWGVGDFLVQRSTRRFGDLSALFFVSGFAAIALLPFVFKDIHNIFTGNIFWLFLLAAILVFVSSLFDYEALRRGKASVIAPVFSFEIVVAAILSWTIIGEKLGFWQVVLVLILASGLFFVSTKSFTHFRSLRTERGVWQAILATFGVAGVSFCFAVVARESDPLLVNWFSATVVFIFIAIYILIQKRFVEVVNLWKENKFLALSVGFFTNFAWISFTAATLFIPIAIATGISEGYIALTVLLGLIFNKEKLRHHQKIGLVLTIAACICLAFISNY